MNELIIRSKDESTSPVEIRTDLDEEGLVFVLRQGNSFMILTLDQLGELCKFYEGFE